MRILICLCLMFLAVKGTAQSQETVSSVDTAMFKGKWFVVASIPAFYDKAWCSITDTYTWNSKGSLDVLTEYKKDLHGKTKSITQQLRPLPESGFAKYVAEEWILKTYYWVLAVADDYSYAITGHPDKTYLYILSRTPEIEDSVFAKIVGIAAGKGYDTGKIKKIPR